MLVNCLVGEMSPFLIRENSHVCFYHFVCLIVCFVVFFFSFSMALLADHSIQLYFHFLALFQNHHKSQSQTDPDQALCCWAWSWSKLFAKVASRRSLAGFFLVDSAWPLPLIRNYGNTLAGSSLDNISFNVPRLPDALQDT